jgi:ATP-dependent Clp protease ATP-binding subunit ClpC
LNRAIQKYLEDAIAEEILKGDLSEGDVITADYTDEATELSLAVTKKEKAD